MVQLIILDEPIQSEQCLHMISLVSIYGSQQLVMYTIHVQAGCLMFFHFLSPLDSTGAVKVILLLVLNALVLGFLGRWWWKRQKRKQYSEET